MFMPSRGEFIPSRGDHTYEATTADRDPTPKTEAEVELTKEEAQQIFGEIMNKVQEDLGFLIENDLPLEHDPEKYGIMVLFDKVLQRISFFKAASDIYSSGLEQTPEIAQKTQEIAKRLLEAKSKIAVCVAFLCHACEHQEVGAAVKSDLRGRPNLKFIIKDIIDFFGGGKFNDLNIESITIDDNSYKVVIKLKLLPKEIEYSLDW